MFLLVKKTYYSAPIKNLEIFFGFFKKKKKRS